MYTFDDDHAFIRGWIQRSPATPGHEADHPDIAQEQVGSVTVAEQSSFGRTKSIFPVFYLSKAGSVRRISDRRILDVPD
jgi:hypothetical protein